MEGRGREGRTRGWEEGMEGKGNGKGGEKGEVGLETAPWLFGDRRP